MPPLPQPFKIIVRPDASSPLQLLSNENDAGTLTTSDLFPRAGFSKRQSTTDINGIIPAGYTNQNSGPAPGTVVGIVLGSVAGFLLILWLLYTCMNFNNVSSGESAYTESVVVRERRKKSTTAGSHSYAPSRPRSRRMSETVEVRRDRSRTPVRIVRPDIPPPARTERIIVEESRSMRRERSPGGSDEVVVIEEHSPPRRSKSKRGSRHGDAGAFRTVDPHAYAGGNAPMRSVRGSRRSSGGRS
ncbi:hypothetical protein PVAG01_07626 [Phlyctema vagabunda]|uniref:Uncharacterized protein n=1 Tax=Phlyctema vagabunda TaxID=108571 RepID=A0ABR4PCZ1_9HELO